MMVARSDAQAWAELVAEGVAFLVVGVLCLLDELRRRRRGG